VVLIAGLGNTADVWSYVVPEISSFTTVCVYDRAGLGRSDPAPPPHGASQAVNDLHTLLHQAGLPGPYVLAGASFGGLIANLYARTFPEDAAGVVFVDAIAPMWDRRLESLLTRAQISARRAIPNGEPISNDEIRASEQILDSTPAFPTVPVVVLRHGVPFPGDADWPTDKVEALWRELQGSLAGLSPESALLVAAASGHHIHVDQPDLVVDAIHAVVDPQLWPPHLRSAAGFGAGAKPVGPGVLSGEFVYGSPTGLQVLSNSGAVIRTIVVGGSDLVSEPSVDATGTRLVFTRETQVASAAPDGPHANGPTAIWGSNIDGGGAHLIAENGRLPVISPDGTQVVFNRGGRTFLVQFDGSGLRDLGEGGCTVWSPDGKRLAMCSSRDSALIVRLSDGAMSELGGPGANDPTAWSPDGKRIALSSTRDGNGEIYVIDADGRNERRITNAPGNQSAEQWLNAGLLVTSSNPDADVSDWYLVYPATSDVQVVPWLHGIPNPIAYLAKS
jgi:pimeloyl-ACP methyl ester carboxylesterase